MLKIIVTGPESSGKTTLCKALSRHFKIPFTEEYAREYMNNLEGDYTQSHLLEIGKGQLLSEHNAQILDTDLITIKIWSNYKYGNCDRWILEQIEKQKTEKRFYLLCKADIPWEGDPQRESPNDRVELFEIYKQELENLGNDYFVVEGDERVQKATRIMQKLISET